MNNLTPEELAVLVMITASRKVRFNIRASRASDRVKTTFQSLLDKGLVSVNGNFVWTLTDDGVKVRWMREYR